MNPLIPGAFDMMAGNNKIESNNDAFLIIVLVIVIVVHHVRFIGITGIDPVIVRDT